jgi:hypothetical protein
MVEAEPHLAGILTASEIETLSEHVASFDFEASLACLEEIAGRLNSHAKSQ